MRSFSSAAALSVNVNAMMLRGRSVSDSARCKQPHHAACDDFCLAGARASDELEVATAVSDGLLLSGREFHAAPLLLARGRAGDGHISVEFFGCALAIPIPSIASCGASAGLSVRRQRLELF